MTRFICWNLFPGLVIAAALWFASLHPAWASSVLAVSIVFANVVGFWEGHTYDGGED